MAITKYGDIGSRTAAFAAKKMLEHAEPVLILSKFGQTKELPQNSTNNIKFRRPVPFAVDPTPLEEGVTPTAQQMQYEDVMVQMEQYGETTVITDVIADTSEDPVLNDVSMLSGEQAAATMEAIIWGAIRAGTNVIYSNGDTRSGVNKKITLGKQQQATRALKAQKAKKITSILDASVKYTTRPIEAAYVAVAHTNLEADIRALPGFTPVAEYGTRKPLCPEELGSVEDVRYVVSPDLEEFQDAGGTATNVVSTGGSQADVYPIIYIGRDAYATVPLKGKNAMRPIVINPDTADKSDPLGQRGYVSWKAYFASLILNQTWMVRLEVAASEL